MLKRKVFTRKDRHDSTTILMDKICDFINSKEGRKLVSHSVYRRDIERDYPFNNEVITQIAIFYKEKK